MQEASPENNSIKNTKIRKITSSIFFLNIKHCKDINVFNGKVEKISTVKLSFPTSVPNKPLNSSKSETALIFPSIQKQQPIKAFPSKKFMQIRATNAHYIINGAIASAYLKKPTTITNYNSQREKLRKPVKTPDCMQEFSKTSINNKSVENLKTPLEINNTKKTKVKHRRIISGDSKNKSHELFSAPVNPIKNITADLKTNNKIEGISIGKILTKMKTNRLPKSKIVI